MSIYYEDGCSVLRSSYRDRGYCTATYLLLPITRLNRDPTTDDAARELIVGTRELGGDKDRRRGRGEWLVVSMRRANGCAACLECKGGGKNRDGGKGRKERLIPLNKDRVSRSDRDERREVYRSSRPTHVCSRDGHVEKAICPICTDWTL